MKVILASGCDEAYYPRIEPFTKSVYRHNTYAEQYLVGVGWMPPKVDGFIPVHLPMSRVRGNAMPGCVQYGDFLKVIPHKPEDVIIYTDSGDVIMQRDFDEIEKLELETMSPETVMVGWNAGPDDKLGYEAHRLGMRVPIEKISTLFDLDLPVYNTGVVVATGNAWQTLFEGYMKLWDVVDPMFHHYARMQWLMSYVLNTDKHLNPAWLPYSFHTHGCYPLPGNISRDEDWVIYDNRKVVLFKHHLGL